MQSTIVRVGVGTLLLTAAILVAAGCTAITAGLNVYPKVPDSAVQFRTELEVVPDAELVREDTMPRWQLGRHAFRKGLAQLVVVTHFTIMSEPVQKGEPPAPGVDRIMERVWVTIPQDTQIGQELDLEELEYRHLVGYDAGDIGDGMFREPYKVTGKITLLEQKPGAVTMHLNVLVAPKRRPVWSVYGTYDVIVAPRGIHATPVALGPRDVYAAQQADAGVSLPIAQVQQTPVEIVAPPVEDAQPAVVPPAGDADPQVKVTVPGTPEEIAAALVGKWVNQSARWYDRFQFEKDGSYVYANCRVGGYPPAIHLGTWEVRGDFVIITTRHYTYGHASNPNEDREMPNPTVGYLKVRRFGSDLLLEGKIQSRGGMHEKALRLGPTDFPDMRMVAPPPIK